MKSDATGPALEGTFDKWDRDTIDYQNYLFTDTRNLKKKNLARITQVKKEWGSMMESHGFEFSKDEITSLLIYIEY